jgi:hypothetical protein
MFYNRISKEMFLIRLIDLLGLMPLSAMFLIRRLYFKVIYVPIRRYGDFNTLK